MSMAPLIRIVAVQNQIKTQTGISKGPENKFFRTAPLGSAGAMSEKILSIGDLEHAASRVLSDGIKGLDPKNFLSDHT